MISIGLVGAGDAAAYYLDRGADCDHEHARDHEHDRDGARDGERGHGIEPASGATVDYYTGEAAGQSAPDDGPETSSAGNTGAAGRWLGGGAGALGLTGAIDATGGEVLRGLLAGRGPVGHRLVAPVLRADPRGRLPAEPFVRTLERLLPREAWSDLGDARQSRALLALATRTDAGRPATVAVEVVARIAARTGLDPVALYRDGDGTDRYTGALRHADKRRDVRRAGLDVTVSAPKSVSVLMALGSPEVEAAVHTAHATAVGEVIAYLQRHAARAARGHHGDGQRANRIGSDGLIVAAFDHASSRAGDPQLHTHLVIPNLIHAADGRWSALDSRALFRHARTASSLYQAVLRGELTRTLGVGWGPVRRGIAEIDGIPAKVRATFSKRRAQIERALHQQGTSGPKAAQAATLATRDTKRAEAPGAARARWEVEARAAGFGPEHIAALVRHCGDRRTASGPIDVVSLARELLGANGVTADQTTFTRQDLARALCDRLPVGMPLSLAGLDQLVTHLITDPAVVPVLPTRGEHVDATGGAGERRYTTAELLTVERHALALATAKPARPVAVAHLHAGARWAALSDEQQQMVGRMLTSGSRVDVVAGPPGSGKSAALACAFEQWQRAGIAVWGASVSRLAATNLHHSSGIPTTSVAAMLGHAERGVVPHGVVLVIDEASLVNTRTLARLLDAVHAVDGKLVLVGDPDQLPEIGAGGLYTHLVAEADTIRLTGNQRQTQAWERQALSSYRTGDVGGALDAYLEHERVHTANSADELTKTIARDYLTATEHGRDVLVLAPLRRDVAALNESIRTGLIAEGRLGRDELVIATRDARGDNSTSGDLRLRVGDQVMVTANDTTLGVVNGSRGTVTSVDAGRQALTMLIAGRPVSVGAEWLASGHLVHGYALTVHKAQGLTVDATLVYAGRGLTREHAYVALSRGRTANHLYLAPADLERPDCAPPDRADPVGVRTLLDDLRERLHDRTTQQLASDHLAAPSPAPLHSGGLSRDCTLGAAPAAPRPQGLAR
ncbi:MAG TPA: MobF family relaxase [Mycobacteriales bacterium]|nr:MobF family relaxase [Mycobacteriales bacterium]